MATIKEYNLYVASWEHLYLLPDGVPAGLPYQLFCRHPWALILFENLYCDENGFRGERNAAEQMQWTNSELFVKLASSEYDIIKPINLKTPLRVHVDDIEERFREKHGVSITKAIEERAVSVDELFEWRLQLLSGFLDEHKLVLYDWPIAGYRRTIPVSLQVAVKDVLSLEIAAVPLTKDIRAELSPERKRIFDSLQEFERKPLQDLRSGRLHQPQYFEILKERIHDYREVDMELVKDVDADLDRVMRMRERFGARNGWELVRTYLKAYNRVAHPKELNEIDKELRNRLKTCFKPQLREFGPAMWKIAKGAVSFIPWLGEARDVVEMAEPAKEAGELLSDYVQFFRGDSRQP